MDLTQLMSAIKIFREKESHRSEKELPLSFFLFQVSIFESSITNKLSYLIASRIREFESLLKIYLYYVIVDRRSIR